MNRSLGSRYVPSLWVYLESLLAKDPAARPPSAAQAADMLLALEPELAGLPPVPLMRAVPLGSNGSRVSPDANPDPFGPSGLHGWPGQGTVLRYRDRGGYPRRSPPRRRTPGFVQAAQRRPSPVTGRNDHRYAHGASS